MEKELLELAILVYDYSKAKKIADINFLDKVIEKLVSFYNVDDYLLATYLADVPTKDFLCAYDYYEKVLFIDHDSLYYHITKLFDQEKNNGISTAPEDLYYKINISFISVIANNVVRAKQYKKVDRKDDDLETELLTMSLESIIKTIEAGELGSKLSSNERKYIDSINTVKEDNIYLMALPSQRMANINATKVSSDISNILTVSSDLKTYMKLRNEREKKSGYENGDCPSAYILSVHNRLKNNCGLTTEAEESYDVNRKYYLNKINECGLGLDDILYYGLPLSNENYDLVNKKINVLTRKIVDKE